MYLHEVPGHNPRSALIVDAKKRAIQIRFPFDMKFVELVRTIPDRSFDKADKKWRVPVSPWHCAKIIQVLKPHGFFIDPEIVKCANAKAARPNLRKQLPTNLYPYQKEAVEFTYAAKGRVLIGDAPGVGKTAPALVWANMFGGKKILIVAPANVTYKWAEKEVPMWAAGKSVQVVEGGKNEMPDTDITIMSYRTMVMRYEELSQLPFDTMIFDEAHYLKSNKSQQNRVARKLTKGVPYLLMLTGTAFKNKRFEIFQLLNMLDPQVWGNAIDFGVRYCGGSFSQGHWIIPPNDETNTEELQDRLAPIMIRRTKKQVAIDLPDLTRVSLPIILANQAEYKKSLVDARERAKALGYKPGHALTILNALRQVVGMGKVDAAIELADELLDAGEQIVIHAHHKAVVNALIEKLTHLVRGYQIGVIDGSTPPKVRQEQANSFLSGELRVMVISSAGKEGLDLFSSSHLIMVERQWTPADEEQIEARLHRNGQKNAVTVHYFIAKGTIDERFDNIVRSKRGEFERLIPSDVIREIYMKELVN